MKKKKSKKRMKIKLRSKGVPAWKTFSSTMTNKEWSIFRRLYGYKIRKRKDLTIGSKRKFFSRKVASRLHEFAIKRWARKNAGWLAQKVNQSQKQIVRGRLNKDAYRLASSKLETPYFVIKNVGEVTFDDRDEMFDFISSYCMQKRISVLMIIFYRVKKDPKIRRYFASSKFIKNKKIKRTRVLLNNFFEKVIEKIEPSVEIIAIKYILRIDYGYRQ